MDNEIREFQKTYPVKVELELLPWQGYWDRVINLEKEERKPDIIQIGSTWNASLAHLGVLRDLTNEVIDLGGGEIYVPAAWSSCHFHDSARVSSLPWFVDIRAIYYRDDIFNKAEIMPNELESWNAFDKVCKK
ncbi:MAG: extracellular solute-binding protein, partial [bacterium]